MIVSYGTVPSGSELKLDALASRTKVEAHVSTTVPGMHPLEENFQNRKRFKADEGCKKNLGSYGLNLGGLYRCTFVNSVP